MEYGNFKIIIKNMVDERGASMNLFSVFALIPGDMCVIDPLSIP